MNVRDARILGFLAGLFMSYTSFPLTFELKMVNTGIGVLSILIGKKIAKGPSGGLLQGIGIGITAGSLLMISTG